MDDHCVVSELLSSANFYLKIACSSKEYIYILKHPKSYVQHTAYLAKITAYLANVVFGAGFKVSQPSGGSPATPNT